MIDCSSFWQLLKRMLSTSFWIFLPLLVGIDLAMAYVSLYVNQPAILFCFLGFTAIFLVCSFAANRKLSCRLVWIILVAILLTVGISVVTVRSY